MDVVVGDGKSCAVGVLVDMLVGSFSVWGVIVVVDVGVVVVVGGSGVRVTLGVSVGVRHGPCVDLARYWFHSSSWMSIVRRPPGKDSQIVFCWLWLL